MKIFFDDRGANPVPKSFFTTIKKAALAALKECFEEDVKKLKYEVSISLVTDAEITELNKKYREKDKPTDVLSFPAGEAPSGAVFFMGDIVISAETAARQADEYGHSFERELAFLTVHGVLHLLGLDHEASPRDEKIMEEIQDKILSELGL
jgi:probable rRNA maturation factor